MSFLRGMWKIYSLILNFKDHKQQSLILNCAVPERH